MILNYASDIEKKTDNVIICLPFSDLSVENQLKNAIPAESVLLLKGNGLKVRILPGDAKIDNKQSNSKPGSSWNFTSNFEVVDNTLSNFRQLQRFINKKVVLIVGTSTYRYQFGNKVQPLDISFRETPTGFNVSVSGQFNFPAARQQITSFRSTS